MFALTDYTAEELTTLSMGVNECITGEIITITNLLSWDDGDFRNASLSLHRKKIAILREHHVHLLTALGIVSEKEKTLSN